MAQLTGLFQRGGSFYIRILLPKDHPLKTLHTNGRLVHTLGPCSYKAAVIKGTVKRAEILGNYTSQHVAPQQVLATTTLPKKKPIYLREVYGRWLNGIPRSADTRACCERALKLFEEQTGNTPIQALTRSQGESFQFSAETRASEMEVLERMATRYTDRKNVYEVKLS